MKMIKNQQGQSSIEFILSFVFVLALFFLFVNQSLNFTYGYLAHFTTFMASRTFLTHDSAGMDYNNYNANIADAINLAKKNFERYSLNAFLGSNLELEFNRPGSTPIYEYVGSYLNFKRPLSIFEFLGGGTELNLRSESFLGKEPTRAECKEQICFAISGKSCSSNDAKFSHTTLYDNVC